MGLSSDQRALLTLLLEGHDYERIGGVVGTSADEVSRRAHQAAAELEADPAESVLVERVRARLAELDRTGPDPVPTSTLSRDAADSRARRAWIVIGAAAVALVALVVGFTQIGGGDETATTTDARQNVEEDVVTVRLAGVGGAEAKGVARIVRVEDQPAVDVDIEGLAPSGAGESYVLALEDESGKTLPIAFRAVGVDGRFIGRTTIPTAALGLLPSLDFVVLSLAREREAAAALQDAAETRTLPTNIGTTVLRGELPR